MAEPSTISRGHGLGVVRTMPEFREFVDQQAPLTVAQRRLLVDQARVLVENLYVHLPLKRAMHAVDPAQSATPARLPAPGAHGPRVPRRVARHLHLCPRPPHELPAAVTIRLEGFVDATLVAARHLTVEPD